MPAALATPEQRLAALVRAFKRRPDLARLLTAIGLGGAVLAALKRRRK